MAEGTDNPSAAIHLEITRRPSSWRADVTGQNGVISGKLTDNPRHLLRMDVLRPWRDYSQGVKLASCPSIVG